MEWSLMLGNEVAVHDEEGKEGKERSLEDGDGQL
jgi:hypothetical protein